MTRATQHRVTRVLASIADGDPEAVEALLPLVYEHLHDLARRRMAAEPRGHTLQATALVHEAYLRLFDGGIAVMDWDCRGRFYAAAAEAMRRILVDHARRRGRAKRGGGRRRVPLGDGNLVLDEPNVDLLALDEALRALQTHDKDLYDIVMLRYFCGLAEEDVAQALGVSARTVRRHWRVARAWLRREMEGNPGGSADNG
ncbi:MAG: ECF-type sigma factor [Planctomycetota bacterium]